MENCMWTEKVSYKIKETNKYTDFTDSDNSIICIYNCKRTFTDKDNNPNTPTNIQNIWKRYLARFQRMLK